MAARTRIAESIRSIRLGEREITYVLRRTNRRSTVGLMVNHDGLTVASPWSVPLSDIYAMIEASQHWVFDKLEVWQSEQAQVRQWKSGETLYFLGREIRLAVDFVLLGHGAFLSRDRLRVYAENRAAVQPLVTAWYRDQALSHFAERLAAIAPLLGVAPSRLAISNARQQWGSCNVMGVIRLNWRLMQARPAIVDYVVAHELAHLKHMDHSPRFWATVESVCPNYRRLREELHEKDVLYRTI
jgi:predicted metal-dependent hydrolase